MILSMEFLDKLTEDQHEIIETAAEVLYGLIHARYILTAAGMHKMVRNIAQLQYSGTLDISFCILVRKIPKC